VADKELQLDNNFVCDDTEAVFQLGLKAWENFTTGSNFEKAKIYIGEAKQQGHPLAGMYWDIICAFEEANAESKINEGEKA